MQGLDFLYNSRDWLTRINHQNLSAGNDPGGDGNANRISKNDIYNIPDATGSVLAVNNRGNNFVLESKLME